MKKIICIIIICCFSTSFFFAKKVKEQKVYGPNKFSIMMNYGIAWAKITRIQTQEKRSNFVWQDDLIGLFYSLQSRNAPLNFLAKISAYYPYQYEFNKFPQKSKQVILYAFDLDFGPIWTIPIFKIATLDLCPLLNIRYQLSDKFHHIDLGIGVLAGLEFPISQGFTILLNGEFIYSNGNLGTNNRMQPYNYVWSYNAQLGVRFSKKRAPNQFYYIKPKSK